MIFVLSLVAGLGLTDDDLASLELSEGVMGVVERFKYLGSMVEACGGVVGEVGCGIAQASRAFGNLRSSMFAATDLSLETKGIMYRSVVLDTCNRCLQDFKDPR